MLAARSCLVAPRNGSHRLLGFASRNFAMAQVLVKSLAGPTLCLQLPSRSSVRDLKDRLYEREGIPTEELRLISNGKDLSDSFLLEDDELHVTVSLRLLGGKGGFGSLLRGGPQGVRVKKVGHDACRDLATGKRMGQVNNEKKLSEWYSLEKERERLIEEEKERIRKEREEAKPKFDDNKYSKDLTEIREDVSNAVQEGLQAALQKEKEAKEQKRKVEQGSSALHPPSKRHGLWTEFDDLPESDAEDDEKPAAPAASKKAEKATSQPAKKKTKTASKPAAEKKEEEKKEEEKKEEEKKEDKKEAKKEANEEAKAAKQAKPKAKTAASANEKEPEKEKEVHLVAKPKGKKPAAKKH